MRPRIQLFLPVVPLLLLAMTTVMICDPAVARAEKRPGLSGFEFFANPSLAHDFPMTTTRGDTMKLSDLKGQVVILNFWRENCPYCVLEKKYLKAMLRQLNEASVKVLCVNFWDNPALVRQYGQKAGEDLLIAARPPDGARVVQNVLKGRLLGYYLINQDREAIYEVKGFPSSYVIDKTGSIVAAHVGMAEWTQPAVRNWIAKLAGTDPAPNSATDDYVLPEWLDRLLSGTSPASVRSVAEASSRGPRL